MSSISIDSVAKTRDYFSCTSDLAMEQVTKEAKLLHLDEGNASYNRERQKTFHQLMQEICMLDASMYWNFVRMNALTFEELSRKKWTPGPNTSTKMDPRSKYFRIVLKYLDPL